MSEDAGAGAGERRVYRALVGLLRGLEEADARSPARPLARALTERGGDAVYAELLTVTLRLVLVLCAERRGLLVDGEGAPSAGLHELRARLTESVAAASTRARGRVGAWREAWARAEEVFAGSGALELQLDDVWRDADGPRELSDVTTHGLLTRLRGLETALEVEQLGGLYESLMGYRVERLQRDSVCLRPWRVWCSPAEILDYRPPGRARWLIQKVGLARGQARRLEAELLAARAPAEAMAALARLAEPGAVTRLAGTLVLQPTAARRRTSSHYTPRALTEPIVARTLAPLLRGLGPAPASARLLALTICDPTMGSGAFLLAACRVLARHVEAAWRREGAGEAPGGRGELERRARRAVASSCLYGVDKNPTAVALAKLSLWLEVAAPGEGVETYARALRRGDSLVGLGAEQLRRAHWRGDGSGDALASPASARPRLLADLVVGSFFAERSARGRARRRLDALATLEGWTRGGGEGEPPEALRGLQRRARERDAFHWPLEFPEVFQGTQDSAGFDAIVGNPPFAGKNGVIKAGGRALIDWLKAAHAGTHGNADLSAHFLRRAAALLGGHGALGLITTNTICQGDTRDTGLKPLVRAGAVIYEATRTREWPGDASVSVAVVHAAFGRARGWLGETRRLDGRAASVINSRLRPSPERADPARLRANAGKSFQGSIVLGRGFTMTPAERDALVARDPRNAERLFPYLGGEEINSSPTQAHHRYVINFGSMSLAEAARWPALLDIVRATVKPERDRSSHSTARWWHFERPREPVYGAIAGLSRCLVNSQVSKHLVFAFQPTDRVFAHTLYVYPLDSYAAFATLQSRLHEVWAWLLSSSMRNAGIRYIKAACFETFPFPTPAAPALETALSRAGEALYEARARLMSERSIGLTKVYNALRDRAVRDVAVERLRSLHRALDRATLAAYGWSDLSPPPYITPQTSDERRVARAFEDALLDRLFTLNAARAEVEAAAR